MASLFVKFIFSGGLNTLVTYVVYLILLNIFSYKLSFTISYILGIVLSYALNRYWVFKTTGTIKRIILFPGIYLIQYLFGLLVAFVWVEIVGLGEKTAPLASIALSIPITFFLTRLLFKSKCNSIAQ